MWCQREIIALPCPTSSVRVCSPRAMITCKAQHRPNGYGFQGRLWYAKPNVIGPCQCCSREMMAFHALHRSTTCYGQGPGWNASPYVLQQYMLSKCDDAIPRRSHPTVSAVEGQRLHVTPDVIRPLVLPNGGDGIARTISSHHVCCTMEIMASHS